LSHLDLQPVKTQSCCFKRRLRFAPQKDQGYAYLVHTLTVWSPRLQLLKPPRLFQEACSVRLTSASALLNRFSSLVLLKSPQAVGC